MHHTALQGWLFQANESTGAAATYDSKCWHAAADCPKYCHPAAAHHVNSTGRQSAAGCPKYCHPAAAHHVNSTGRQSAAGCPKYCHPAAANYISSTRWHPAAGCSKWSRPPARSIHIRWCWLAATKPVHKPKPPFSGIAWWPSGSATPNSTSGSNEHKQHGRANAAANKRVAATIGISQQ